MEEGVGEAGSSEAVQTRPARSCPSLVEGEAAAVVDVAGSALTTKREWSYTPAAVDVYFASLFVCICVTGWLNW